MATPLTAAKFVAQLKTYHVDYVEHGHWRTHNRNHKGLWGGVNGVMLHHTVTRGTKASLDIVTKGYSGLPGPLCHGMIDKDGTVYLVGWGRANHAGLGDQRVLNAVIAERALPKAVHQTVDGNRRFYGFECVNMGDGEDRWPEEQVDAMCRVSAALCKAHGWSELSVIGHKEWQTGKVDPRGLSMDDLRRRVAKLLKNNTKPEPKPKPEPEKPKTPVVDLSELVKAAKSNSQAKGTPVTYAGVKTVEKALVAEGILKKSLADGHYGTETKKAYATWQRRCGYTGKAADGIPGSVTLKKLGSRYGFDVKA